MGSLEKTDPSQQCGDSGLPSRHTPEVLPLASAHAALAPWRRTAEHGESTEREPGLAKSLSGFGSQIAHLCNKPTASPEIP